MSNKILLIEDDTLYVHIIKSLLKSNYKVTDCKTIKDYQLINQNEYILIILDLNLPDSEGLDTLKTVVKTSIIPIIVVSATNDFDLMKNTIKFGAQDYLVKNNFDENMLLKSITFAIERFEYTILQQDLTKLINEIRNLRSELKELKNVLCQN